MEIQRFTLNVLFLVLPLFLFACEDPSSVGLGLVGDDEGGIPNTRVIPLETLRGVPDDGIRDNAGQVLAGQVVDPTFGTISTMGFIDFRSNLDLPTSYEDGTVEEATLQLIPTYVYGDTVETLTFALHEVLTEFEISGNTQDSIPDIGPELLQFSFTPVDDLIEVPLPESWVTQYEEALRASTFGDTFHGFKLIPVSGNAIVGFQNTIGTATLTQAAARLQGIAGTDTVGYVADKSITQIEKLADGNLPMDRIALQNGITPKIAIDFSIDSLMNQSLNRASLELKIDTEALETPAGFVRPEINTLLFSGVVALDSTSVVLAEGRRNDNGTYTFVFDDNIVVFLSVDHLVEYPQYSGLDFHDIMQKIILGDVNPFLSFDILYPISSTTNTLEGLVIHDLTSVTDAPSIYATTTSR